MFSSGNKTAVISYQCSYYRFHTENKLCGPILHFEVTNVANLSTKRPRDACGTLTRESL